MAVAAPAPNIQSLAWPGVEEFTDVMPTLVATLTGFWPSHRVYLFDGFCSRAS